ncbi:MAG TPA: hypothetical protein P5121_27460 [Caldilineaceae bacterium]|nr:hypothetical protein [Caldilineaceae bacterium]
MKIYRNTKEITRKETIGRRFSLTGLGILFIGMMASFVPTMYPPGTEAPNALAAYAQQYWALASFIALPAGFIFASIGSYFINRFAARRWPNSKTVARPDEMLARSMKGFDDKYTYFAYGLPSQYVVSGPCGVLLFVVRGDRGRITVEGDRWREPFSIGRFFTVFAREGLGNPAREVAEQEGKMKALLQSATETPEDVDLNAVPVAGAAVFLNSDVQLTVDGPTIPVLRADQVKDYIRRKTKEVRLPGATVRALNEFLRTQATFEAAEAEGSQ